MTRIAHLSDPHFGTEPDRLPGLLVEYLATLEPDAVVVSGDLTQRALAGQFRAARRFLSELPAPALVVPGNHDAPLWNLPLRLVDPWRTWRRQLGRPLEGRIETRDAVIVGVNSANPRVWKDGLVPPERVAVLAASFADAGERRRILVLHHPPDPPEGEPPSLYAAEALLRACVGAGVEMILSGHLHFTQVARVASVPGILAVQAGTCLSARIRGEGNAFTLLDLQADGVAVSHHRFAADGAFRADAVTVWQRGAEGWR